VSRRRGAVATLFVALVVVALSGCGGSGPASTSGGARLTATRPTTSPPKRKVVLRVRLSRHRLPTPVSGEAVVAAGHDLLVIGGLDSGDTSTDAVTRFDPVSGAARPAGTLSQPLHDLAAANGPNGVLVFGGGSATTTTEVQRLVPGGSGEAVGQLPVPRSDLSAATIGGTTYVLGGYDGEGTVGAILRTRDGASLETAGSLRVPVRYTALVAVDRMIYAFGGEETSGADTTVIQRFDPTTGKTSIVGHLPGTLAHASAVALKGRIYVLGGRVDGQTSDQILRFEPGPARTRRVGRLPAPVQNAAAGVVGGIAYLIGGLDPAEAPLSSIVAIDIAAPTAG
jgi:hypothetical protein